MQANIFMRPVERFGPASVTFIGQHKLMYDAIGLDSPLLVPFHPQMVLGYDTGSPDITWSQNDWNQFPGIPHVHTDQGGNGAPVHSATLMDIEPGAYRPADIAWWMPQCTAPRPTAYVDRIDCDAILHLGYKDDIVLAWPGWSGEPLPGAPGQVVAVQNAFHANYDITDVLDPYWPGRKPAKEKEMESGILYPGTQDFTPFPAGVFKQIMLYHDFTTHAVSVRVAIHSKSKGYTQMLNDYNILDNVPHTIMFTETDVDGVSLVNKSDTEVVGWTLS